MRRQSLLSLRVSGQDDCGIRDDKSKESSMLGSSHIIAGISKHTGRLSNGMPLDARRPLLCARRSEVVHLSADGQMKPPFDRQLRITWRVCEIESAEVPATAARQCAHRSR